VPRGILAILTFLVACGRIGFDPQAETDAGPDGAMGWTPAVDLVGYWKFDEVSGVVTADSAGTLDGNLGMDASFAAGKFGNALATSNVQASSNSATLGDSTADGGPFAGRSRFTITAWIEIAGLTDPTGVHVIVSDTQTGDCGQSYATLVIYEGEPLDPLVNVQLQFSDPTGTPQILQEQTVMAAGTWYHVAAVYDSILDEQRIYVDGVRLATSSVAIDPIPTSTRGHSVGNGWFDFACANWPLNGRVDELRVYDAALTDAQIELVHRLVP
jgi:hypothetical protein